MLVYAAKDFDGKCLAWEKGGQLTTEGKGAAAPLAKYEDAIEQKKGN